MGYTYVLGRLGWSNLGDGPDIIIKAPPLTLNSVSTCIINYKVTLGIRAEILYLTQYSLCLTTILECPTYYP